MDAVYTIRAVRSMIKYLVVVNIYCSALGDNKHARKLFQRAVNSVTDNLQEVYSILHIQITMPKYD